jgi:acyl carrier protein
MPPAATLTCLGAALDRDVPRQLVADIDWQRLRPVYEAQRPRPLLQALGSATATAPRAVRGAVRPGSIRARLAAAPSDRRRTILVEWLQQEIAGALGLPSGETLPPDRSFFESGLDSLMAVELKGRLENGLDQPVEAAVLLNHATVDSLAGYLQTHLGHASAATADLPPPHRDPDGAPRTTPANSCKEDAVLDPAIAPPSPAPAVFTPRCVLLTGATGYLGGYPSTLRMAMSSRSGSVSSC